MFETKRILEILFKKFTEFKQVSIITNSDSSRGLFEQKLVVPYTPMNLNSPMQQEMYFQFPQSPLGESIAENCIQAMKYASQQIIPIIDEGSGYELFINFSFGGIPQSSQDKKYNNLLINYTLLVTKGNRIKQNKED